MCLEGTSLRKHAVKKALLIKLLRDDVLDLRAGKNSK